jgi:hypothetical protein
MENCRWHALNDEPFTNHRVLCVHQNHLKVLIKCVSNLSNTSGMLHNGCYPCGWQIVNILNWNRMLISMVKPKWILQLCWKWFYTGLHRVLECRDTKLWPVSGCYHNVSTLKGRVNKFYWKLAITPYLSTQGDDNSILQLQKNHHEAARLIPHKWVKKRNGWQKKRSKSRPTFLITKKHTRGKQGLFAIHLQRKPTNSSWIK